ncbi:transglycosylase domain-containing protein [Roseofilum casamattae]|uniref:Transglycosylase domain-containing protein n=1 Tax=Roseofilum casamattae BLCC-M143 TaxID=3022442 RepID=A0ABT7BTD0_9CYAN|nr:transglycosylase domain-containing protein [Roseofilum casamattae]MDJ1182447.1 transglycosylase domain-containing protein [Roseofilum casamattae BLCC-M143]
MSSPQPPDPPKNLLGTLTQVAQTIQARVKWSQLALKANARVAKLSVLETEGEEPETYPLLGDRILIGRSSKSCDIVIRNPVVSQIHCSLHRDPKRGYTLRDEGATNGIYQGKRKLNEIQLHHGTRITLGPPELQASVTLRYVDPPPWPLQALRYTLYGCGGLTALLALCILNEWRKFDISPLPRTIQGPVVVYARDGQTPLVPPANTAHLEQAKLSDFPSNLAKAVIASEDSRFYWHFGIDPVGIARAVLANVRGGGIREGASTVTQQVARSLFRDYVGTSDTAGRKLREMVVALKLETFYSKDFLLLTYLNRIYLGSANYGFEDAARYYLGKSASDLTLSEAATLVGILPAPNSFNPIRDYSAAIRQRDGVLYRMEKLGMISREEADRARRSRININPKTLEELNRSIAPYFHDYVYMELEELLGSSLAREGNFIIETGLDPLIQERAQVNLEQAVATTGASFNFDQGALVTLDSQTGEVLALSGGANYRESQFNRAVQAYRQPGSTFKIFAYTAAISRGISPWKTYSCAPLTWKGQSYRGCERSGGDIDMGAAIAQSENAVALRIAREVGLDQVIRMARLFGIEADLTSAPGLVLGQSELTPLEITGAFAVLANSGLYNRPHAIRRILDSSDCATIEQIDTCRVIYDYQQDPKAGRPAVSPQVAQTMTNLLQGVVASGTGSSANLGLGEEAGKTGTTNNGVDLWFVGYVPSRRLVTGIWLGNDDNSPTYGSSSQAARVWSDYMEDLLF